MLSTTSLQHFPSDLYAPNILISNGHSRYQHEPMAQSGLDALAESSQYALQQLQQQQQTPIVHGMNGGRNQLKDRQSFGSSSIPPPSTPAHGERRESTGMMKGGRATSANNGQSVRRRISRACDQCNQLRTKCDGKAPCQHCVEFGLTCEYARERKKRGKASRKDLAAQQMTGPNGDVKEGSPPSGDGESDEAMDQQRREVHQGIKRRRSSGEFQTPQLPPPRTNSINGQHMPHANGILPSMEQVSTIAGDPNALERQHSATMTMDQRPQGMVLPTPRLPSVDMHERGMPVSMGEYGTMDDYHRSILHPGATMPGHNILHSGVSAMPNSMITGGTITGYGESPYGAPSPNNSHAGAPPPFRMGESPISGGFLGQSPGGMAGSPGWFSLPSPSGGLGYNLQQIPSNQALRYPVLRPLLPHISTILPTSLACDLLELYFTCTSSAFLSPQSPYILGYMFRKRSFLRQNPRPCSPALLASMLWIAAQTSESSFLTSPPSARGKTCQKLHELTVSLLKPLIHAPTDGTVNYGNNSVINGVALGGFGVGMPGQAHETEGGSPGATGALDDVATYIHLATVVSASEYKAASLRWWNAAWSLARELKLGREQPPIPESQDDAQNGDGQYNANGEPLSAVPTNNGHSHSIHNLGTMEEEREERRRIWWLLYIVDRHLALCYNRPLFLLDIECDGLFQPENDLVWQANEYYTGDPNPEAAYYRRRGPCFECTGHGIFGYFLPLMTILGEIVDLNHARNHPRFGLRFRSQDQWDGPAQEISQQLEAYGRSLKDFEARNAVQPSHALENHHPEHGNGNGENGHHDPTSPSGHSVASSQRMTETQLQTKIVVAYGTHLMHTLHILVNGKWDPISLLDDNDLWISSQSFISATGHAVSAAEAINEILDYDPDLSFMPFFFGIYLLQGSFLLLLIADKLQGGASPNVVKACETIVRAHEACVVTLNTEYQRNFRKVMRSALAQVRGRMVEDLGGEQQLRRREVLALYRWTGDGTGLAL